jgi:hypothetical protein
MRVYVPLRSAEVDELVELAVAERRLPQQQAAYLLARAIAEAKREREARGESPQSSPVRRHRSEVECVSR